MEIRIRDCVNKARIKLLLIGLLITAVSLPTGICQVDSLTQILREKLSLDAKPKLSVAIFLPKCWPIDDTEHYMVRAKQANANEVLDVLEAILAQRDSSYFLPVLDAHQDYIKVFKAEVWPLLWKHDKIYLCDNNNRTYIPLIGEQLRILDALQYTLRVLYFRRMRFTGEQVYEYEINYFSKLLDERNGVAEVLYELGIDFFAVEAMQARNLYFYPGRRISSSFASYEEDVLPYLLRHILVFRFQDFKYKENIAYDRALNLMHMVLELAAVSNKRVNSELDSCFIAVSQNFIQYEKASWLYKALGNTPTSTATTHYFVRLLFENSTLLKLNYEIRDMMLRTMWHESRKEDVKQILLDYLEKGNPKEQGNTLFFLRVYADDEVALACQRLLDKKDALVLNPLLVAELLETCLTNPKLSDNIRISTTNALNSIKR